MTKNELQQVFYLNKELKMWKKEREKLEERIGSSGKWIDGMPRGSGTGDPTGNLASEIANCKMMISCKEMEIQIQKNRIIRYIDGIDNSVLRQIIFYRCVALKPWNHVAAEIGGLLTGDSARMTFNRHFDGGCDETERLT